ncbi:MAG: hypothetical protein GY731_02775 [Gammaproteobacteria bacterium]|nr:hypothetical protein [Gammaproteobacteria bacterium]
MGTLSGGESFQALIDLQESGRLVGIISHVPELKERIDVRLEILASRGGGAKRGLCFPER